MNNSKISINNPRIAWLLTSAFYYWHPTLSHLTKLFPKTTAFAANWRGYARGYENSFNVEVVGERKVFHLIRDDKSYGTNFTYMPLQIVNRLFQFKPQVIFSNSFGIWTILALLFKPLGMWKVVIAYEGSSPCVDFRNDPLRLFLRRAMVRAASACITNSQAGKAYLTEFLNANPNRVFVHPYQVPAAGTMFSEQHLAEVDSSDSQQPIFLFVGSLEARKGLDWLLKACAILQERGCDRYTLQIVGSGEQREELETFVRNKGLSDRVQWIGQVDYNKLGKYFTDADIFVLPTLEDTWGMVVLEAMVLGNAILCSKWAGASELAIEGENGYRFDPHQPEQLADLMRRFIDDPQLAAVMGKKSKQLMAQYTPEAAAQFLSKVTSFVLEQ